MASDNGILTRAALLAPFAVLDTPAEAGFDDAVALAQDLCRAPIALVSLVADDRQWFKARAGFADCQTDLDRSVCRFVVDAGELVVIPDLTQDSRTAENPLVTGDTAVRFYAGAPLIVDDGTVLGALCVLDTEPRPAGLDPAQRRQLSALAGQVSRQLELRRALAERDAALALIRSGEGDRIDGQDRLIALVEIGEKLRACNTVQEMTSVTAAIVGRLMGATRAGYGEIDVDTRQITIEPDWTADGVASIAGTHRFEDFGRIRDELARAEPLVIVDVDTDPRTAPDPGPMHAVGIRAMINMPVREHGRTVAAFIVHSDVPRVWSVAELVFIRSVADRLETGIARVRAEGRQDVLNREIAHRLKNTLAVVSAIANQSLRKLIDRPTLQGFLKRLEALGAAHDALTTRSWDAAELEEIILRTLEVVGVADRVTLTGPKVAVGPRAAQSTSLLIHELATNAMKYGSLSAAGSVAIEWRIDQDGDANGGILTLDWIERDGPPAIETASKGFGSRLISLGLAGTGGATIGYHPSGLQACFTADLTEMAET